jgi:hypothetical protein
MQGAGTGVDGNAVGGSAVGGKFFLESRHFTSQNELTALQNLVNGRVNFVLNTPVLGL